VSKFLRGIAVVVVSLLTTSIGAAIGIFGAFWYIYIFVDENRAGEAGVGTNISFLGAAFAFGLFGLILGVFAAWGFLRRGFLSKPRVAAFGEVDR
jgi:hypothetical protein